MVDPSVLDLTRLTEAYEDDVAGIAELLQMALGTHDKHLNNLRAAIAAHDAAMLARAAHGIKGSSSNIGAGGVTRVSTEIDARARDGRWDGIDELAAELEAAVAALKATVEAYRAAVLSA
jgi:HPt (histidine-containing phosphotransfer) domain-containing protein